VLGAGLAALAGCGGREFAEVEGLITLNGQPLPDVEVVFLPDPELDNPGPRAGAYTDARGRYRLHVERPPREGTVLGPHRVCIIDIAALPSPVGGPNPAEKPKVSRVPLEYNTAAKTPIRHVEIKPGKQTLDFNVKSGKT
jgi:hypothetical protein